MGYLHSKLCNVKGILIYVVYLLADMITHNDDIKEFVPFLRNLLHDHRYPRLFFYTSYLKRASTFEKIDICFKSIIIHTIHQLFFKY